MNIRPYTVYAIVAILSVLAVVVVLSARDVELTELPPRQTVAQFNELPHDESYLMVSARVDLDAIQARLNASAPFSMDFEGSPVIGTIRYPVLRILGQSDRVKVRAPHKIRVTRRPISVTGSDDTLVFRTQLKLKGHVGLTGALAESLALDKKNIDGKVDIEVSARFTGVTDGITPPFVLSAKVDVRRARFELLPRLYLNLEREAQQAADAAVASLEADIARQLSPQSLLSSLSGSIWRQSVSQIGSSDAPLYAVFSPTDLALSRMDVLGKQASVSLGLFGNLSVVAEKPDTSNWNQPVTFRTIDRGQSRARLSVPMRLTYEAINAELAERLPIETEASIEGAKTRLTVTAAEFYPSGERLALVVDLKADFPGIFADTRGKLALVGRPVVVSTARGSVLRLEDISFARQLDNRFWHSVTALGQDQLIDLLEETLTINIDGLANSTESALNSFLAENGQVHGFSASASGLRLGFEIAGMSNAGLDLVAELEVPFEVAFETVQLD